MSQTEIEQEALSRPETLRRVCDTMTRQGLPAPEQVEVYEHGGYDWLRLKFDASADLDSWAQALGFEVESSVTDRAWHYNARGRWLGRVALLQVWQPIPSGDDLVGTDGAS